MLTVWFMPRKGSIVNMSGGYVCGATSMSHGAGIELGIKNGNGKGATLNLTGGVIAGNYAPEGGGGVSLTALQ